MRRRPAMSSSRRRGRAVRPRSADRRLRTAAPSRCSGVARGCRSGNLAAAIGMSKSGLYAHFRTKQDLQLATVEEAERILTAEVIQPALAARPGLGQLAAVCEALSA